MKQIYANVFLFLLCSFVLLTNVSAQDQNQVTYTWSSTDVLLSVTAEDGNDIGGSLGLGTTDIADPNDPTLVNAFNFFGGFGNLGFTVTVNLVDASGAVVAMTEVDENGEFLFEDIPDGTYTTSVVIPAGVDVTGLGTGSDGGFTFDAGTNTLTSDPFGVSETDDTPVLFDDVTLVEAAIAYIGERLYIEANGNGIYEPENGDFVLAGVTVILNQNDGLNGIPVATAVTDENGYFFFEVEPGQYFITVVAPNNSVYSVSPTNATGATINAEDVSESGSGAEGVDNDAMADPTGEFLAITEEFTAEPGQMARITIGLIDECLDFDAAITRICNSAGNSVFVIVASGGDAPYSVSGSYTYAGTTSDYTGTLTEGEVANVVVPTNETDIITYNFTITDETGCASVTLENDAFPCNTLGVDLLAFDGRVKEQGNLLEWATASEMNNDFFTLFHSTDGVNFDAVAVVEGMGTTNNISQYSFLDKNAKSGVNYYYLHQTDFSGAVTEVSEVITLNREPKEFSIDQVYPVPATSVLNINFNAVRAGTVTLEVYDIAGRLVSVVENDAQEGLNANQMNISDLAVGTYFVKATDGESTAVHKFIKN